MRRWVASYLVLSAVLIMCATPSSAQVSVKSLPPAVVKTVPEAGDTDVDPNLTEIRVTFSKDMMTENMWSWVIQTKNSFPKIVGDVKFLPDGRTCVAPVKLQPGRTYAIWFNSPDYRYNAFRDKQNNPAVPYLLVFQTRK